MGLDNIPTVYPCRKAGVPVVTIHPAVEPDGEPWEQIDCDATIEAGRCPWAIAQQGRGEPVTGMLGTYCWYRGKSGTWMLELLAKAGYENPHGGIEGFYGDSEMLTPDHCRALGKWMAEHIEAFAQAARAEWEDVSTAVEEYRYAAWWLTWIADAGDGAQAWW